MLISCQQNLSYVISLTEGSKKGPGMMQDGALINKIKCIGKPLIIDVLSRHELPPVPISNTVMLQRISKAR